jgi:hypothetical protein
VQTVTITLHAVTTRPADAGRFAAGGRQSRRAILLVGLLVFALLLGVLSPEFARPVLAQGRAQDGATLTVLRGQVAVIHPDGSAVQPAPSGTIVRAGDEIRTLTQSGALITLFAGTEIELGENTILVIDRIIRTGDGIEISLKQALGASLHRVQSLGSASSYRVEVGGAVAVVRGTTFLLYGPTDENVVGILCLDDCTPATTFAGCPMAPNLGYWAEVDRGQVVSGCNPIRADGSIWNTPGTLRLTRR